MSNRFHSKWHRHNHSTNPTTGEPDSSHDPIASPSDPFQGDFILNGALSSNDIVYAGCGDSRDWCSTHTTVNSSSANWDSTFTTVSSNSANWDSTFTTVSSNSANWVSTHTTVYNNSASWGGGTISLPQSANWESTYTTVCSNSANWESTRNTVCANSGIWEYNSFLNSNPHVGFNDKNTYPVYTSIDNTSYTGLQFLATDNKSTEHVFYESAPGPSVFDNGIYKGFFTVRNSELYYADEQPIVAKDSVKYPHTIIRADTNSLIVRTQHLTASNPLPGWSDPTYQYWLYSLSGSFVNNAFINPIDITSIATNYTPPGNANNTNDIQFIRYNGKERFIQYRQYTVQDSSTNAYHRLIDMTVLSAVAPFNPIGNTLTIYNDLCAGFSLYNTPTAYYGELGTYAHILSSSTDTVPQVIDWTRTQRNLHTQIKFTYMPEKDQVFGVFTNIITYKDITGIENYRNFITSLHFTVPEDLLDTGFNDETDITPIFPTSTDILVSEASSISCVYLGEFISSPGIDYWIHPKNFTGLLWYALPFQPFVYYEDSGTEELYTNINNTKFIIPLSSPLSLASTFTHYPIKRPNLSPMNQGVYPLTHILSSNCLVFTGLGNHLSTDLYDSAQRLVMGELASTRTLLTEMTSYALTAHAFNFVPGTISTFRVSTDSGWIGENYNPGFSRLYRHTWFYSPFSTTIDSSNITHNYFMDMRSNAVSTWPVYEMLPLRDVNGSLFISGVWIKDVLNPSHPLNIPNYDPLNPFITQQLSSSRVKSYFVSGDDLGNYDINYIIQCSPASVTYNTYSPNPDLDDMVFAGRSDWQGMQRILTDYDDTLSFVYPPPLSAAFVALNVARPGQGSNYTGGSPLLDLADRKLYYRLYCNLNTAVYGVRDLDTNVDILDNSVGFPMPAFFGNITDTDLNLGKYVAIMSSAEPIRSTNKVLKDQVIVTSEKDPDGIKADISLMDMISTTPPNTRPNNQYSEQTPMNIITIKSSPTLAVYILDYPIFLGGKYFEAPISDGYKVLPLEPNEITYIYLTTDYINNSIGVTSSLEDKPDTFNRVKIAKINTDATGVTSTVLYTINAYDIGKSLEVVTDASATPTDLLLKVTVNVDGVNKIYGIKLWELT